MRNWLPSFLKYQILFLGSFISFLLTQCISEKNEVITIAAASSMQFTLDELVTVFAEETGVECKIVTGASGMLTAQITQGAPYDLFLSADLEYPQYVYKKGLSVKAPLIYAKGSLILWSVTDTLPESLKSLSNPIIAKIAVANPETAPYGKAAVQVLSRYGIHDAIKEKLVYGANISQVNQFIVSGSVSYGFTAKSVLMSPDLKNKGVWMEIDSLAFEAIDHGLVLLKSDTKRLENAKAFVDFLRSTSGRRILEKYGYKTPNH